MPHPCCCRNGRHSLRTGVLALLICGVSSRLPWPQGRVLVGTIDAALAPVASAVLDELERKTLVHVVRREGAQSIAIRTTPDGAGRGGTPPGGLALPTELCCFRPNGGTLESRRLALALLHALGVGSAGHPPAGNGTAPAGAVPGAEALVGFAQESITPVEADAVNALYAREVLPGASALPARIEVGVWQLVPGYAPAEWADMVGGRGRRVVGGAMRWARGLADAGHATGIVGALPTFIFRGGNKAEVVLLGNESAEVAPGSAMPAEVAGEGLGAGIRRATLHARGRGFTGGVPTHLGDGSALLLRPASTEVTATTEIGESLKEILQEHHAAFTLGQVSRWAQNRGALLGLPSFVRPEGPSGGNSLEVMLLRKPARRVPGILVLAGPGDDSQQVPYSATVVIAGTVAGCLMAAWICRRPDVDLTADARSERDLQRFVNML